MASVPALPGHALGLLLLQLALILFVSRTLAEGAKRLGQPAVLGELMAGIVLGPSVLGAVLPAAMHALFPAEPLQVHLLEVVAWVGMVLLLLLTGLETDVRLLRHLGRSALGASALGMIVPFAAGFLLGLLTPEQYMGDPGKRILFSTFLATAMSISAMPVIAKILMDLELTKRNIGVVILSAGVVDDTTGWLILSIIAGVAGATEGVALRFGQTLLLTVLFLAASVGIFYPVARRFLRFVEARARTPNADLVAVVAFGFALAALTETIGVHAVFGAFVAGCVLRQVPTLRPATVHRLESVALSLFAPIFFATVGLKVDLRTLPSAGMILVVLAVATAGKLVGCTAGGLLGRMSVWESLAIGVAMNARGAMELVVALLGLTLGIINPPMFAIIVVMAIATSFMAPILLRLILPRIRLTPEEEARMQAVMPSGLFSPARLRTLIPTAGGPNALAAARIAVGLTRGEGAGLTVCLVQTTSAGPLTRLWRRLRPDQAGRNLKQHLDTIKAFADERKLSLDVRRATEPEPVPYIVREAERGFDLVFVGAGGRSPLRTSVSSELLERAPCHVAVVRAQGQVADPQRILVATNGSFFSRAAVELAVLYAERVGAHLTVLYTSEAEGRVDPDATVDHGLEENFRRMMATTLLSTLSPLVARTSAQVSVIVRESDQPTAPVVAEARTGLYQLVVVGAEREAVQHRLSVGYDIERITTEAPCASMVVIPRIGIQARGG